MEQVLSKLRKADVTVLATPVYFYTMCAQMKIIVDRTLGGAQKLVWETGNGSIL